MCLMEQLGFANDCDYGLYLCTAGNVFACLDHNLRVAQVLSKVHYHPSIHPFRACLPHASCHHDCHHARCQHMPAPLLVCSTSAACTSPTAKASARRTSASTFTSHHTDWRSVRPSFMYSNQHDASVCQCVPSRVHTHALIHQPPVPSYPST